MTAKFEPMTALDIFVRDAAVRYLQSVVFVDDRIYFHKMPQDYDTIDFGSLSGLKPQFAGETRGDEGAPTRAEEPIAASETTQEEIKKPHNDVAEKQTYHPRDLMESFARNGIVCALYEPREGFKSDPGSDLFLLCEKADVVILDWDLFSDDGDGTSALLAELIKKGEADLPHHVRLCAIYTDKPSLHPILDRLLVKLQAEGCSVSVVEGKLQLACGATRISILGKPNATGRPPVDKPYEVQETDLADRVISDFANLHHGLMPAIALHGLASVRKNTRRLLDKFDAKLDGAFLLHRALGLADHDAFEELPDLLGHEILAILEDTRIDDGTLDKIASAVISSLPLCTAKRDWKDKDGKPLDQKEIFRRLLLKGEKDFREALGNSIQKDELEKRGFRGIKSRLLTDFDQMVDESRTEQLAAIYCNRTQYGNNDRKLHFGTVVRHKRVEGDPWEYSVCLMPICDSQRLKNAFSFPFWRLKDDAREAKLGKKNGVVIIDPEGKPQCLTAGGKIRSMLWIQEFAPSPGGRVMATRNAKSFRFDVANLIIEWVAELKPLHTQRIAAHMGTEVSRVGLVESEWLRLYCDR